MVKSILLYNCCTWGLTKQDELNLNSFHRQQLRKVIGIRWPHVIRSKNVYRLTNQKPVTIEITERRWKMLGHVLRLDKNTPARKAMKFFFEKRESSKKFKGRKRASIVTTINNDIAKTKSINPNFAIKKLKTEVDLHNIGSKAGNRKQWKIIVATVVKAAYSDISTYKPVEEAGLEEMI